MTPPTPTKGGDKPAAEEPAPPAVDPAELEKVIADLTAKVEALDFTAALEAEVAKYLGADGTLTKELGTRLEQLDALLQAKTETLGEEASTELEKLVQWAHARISALHVGVSRAIGVTIDLPESPTHQPSSDVTVTGTETADRLVH